MAKGRLFEYALLYHPQQTKEQQDLGQTPKSTIVKTPETVLAVTEQEVSVIAARAIPEQYLDKLEQVEILVRPF